jgi:ribonucleoside-diphosphate reductase alpha chain
MCGEAYAQSSRIAKEMGPFKGYAINREPMLNVMNKHSVHADKISKEYVPNQLWEASSASWKEAIELGKVSGYRNGQATVLAPTGTIGFMMDCDTTGVEPDIALVKYKKLVGGGMMKIVNQTVPEALRKLNYDSEQIEHIISYIDKNDTIEGAPFLKEEHLSVFDCAFKPSKGKRSIQYMGHIKMMGATQPFLSGAISKTVNMPTEVTPDDIMQAYVESWKLGLKAVAVYRDGCKRTQPLSTSLDGDKKKEEKKAEVRLARRRLPAERAAYTHKFSIAGHEGYITAGMYEDGLPGEVFITMSKEGSTLSGMMDAFATSISIALQYGVPVKVLVDKFSHMRFEPSGFTQNPEIPIAKSICDYIFRWLGLKFLPKDEQPINVVAETNVLETPKAEVRVAETFAAAERGEKYVFQTQADAPPCHECGSLMIRSGACYKCTQCGSTSGCS